jgi:hypothetical protein
METDTTLLLDLDERNLAHFLSALALAALARRVRVQDSTIKTIESRRCWWPNPGDFAIQTELPAEQFGPLLFTAVHDFLKAMKWHPGLGGPAYGILVSGREIGVNPFIALSGEPGDNTPLKGFSARVLPGATLPEQLAKLQAPGSCPDWLNQLNRGAGSWGFDSRVNMHASDAGISSDAENSGHLDPFYPAVELLGLAAAAFFVPAHAWQVETNALLASAWTQPVPLAMAALATTGRIHGLPARRYKFAYRGAAHGKGSAYHFFPPATIQRSIL